MKKHFPTIALRWINLLVLAGLLLFTMTSAQAEVIRQSTHLASHGIGNEFGDMPSKFSSLAAWKKIVTFDSRASNLDWEGGPAADENEPPYFYDIMLKNLDLATGNVALVSQIFPDGVNVINGDSYYPVINRVMSNSLSPDMDGRYIVYQTKVKGLADTENPTLVDNNDKWDIFLTEVSSGRIWRVSVADDDPSTPDVIEDDADGDSGTTSLELPMAAIYLVLTPNEPTDYYRPFVVFQTKATNLIRDPLDTNGKTDIYVRDVWGATGIPSDTVLLSRKWDADNQQWFFAEGNSYGPSVSEDGRWVVFTSDAALLSEDTNGKADVYLLDRDADMNDSCLPEPDGIYDEFNEGNPNCPGTRSVRYYLVSRDLSTGFAANGESKNASISADGAFIAFQSQATNLVDGDVNGYSDIFVYHFVDYTTSDTMEMVSTSDWTVNAGNVSYEQAQSWSGRPVISGDGRRVAFQTYANNLRPDDTNINLSSPYCTITPTGEAGPTCNVADIYIHDRLERLTWRVSLNNQGEQGTRDSVFPAISGDGQYVSFWTNSNFIGSGDYIGSNTQVFLRDLGNPAGNPSLTPTSWKFGDRPLADPVSARFRIFFLGTLEIFNIEIEGVDPDRQQFQINTDFENGCMREEPLPGVEGSVGLTGMTYDPRDICYFDVVFNSNNYGVYSAAVRIDIWDPNVVSEPHTINRQIFLSVRGSTLFHFMLPIILN
jgi:Tol biopolymer transport system component